MIKDQNVSDQRGNDFHSADTNNFHQSTSSASESRPTQFVTKSNDHTTPSLCVEDAVVTVYTELRRLFEKNKSLELSKSEASAIGICALSTFKVKKILFERFHLDYEKLPNNKKTLSELIKDPSVPITLLKINEDISYYKLPLLFISIKKATSPFFLAKENLVAKGLDYKFACLASILVLLGRMDLDLHTVDLNGLSVSEFLEAVHNVSSLDDFLSLVGVVLPDDADTIISTVEAVISTLQMIHFKQ